MNRPETLPFRNGDFFSTFDKKVLGVEPNTISQVPVAFSGANVGSMLIL
jgi:hypothetical protein